MTLSRSRPRSTVRWPMIAVAIGGLCLGFMAMQQRASTRRAQALDHAAREAEARELVAEWEGGGVRLSSMGREEAEATAERLRRSITYHEAMKRKWEQAADRPWLSVPPDPPNARSTLEKLR